jgi:thiol-disulfide isomerase/thioredoxin
MQRRHGLTLAVAGLAAAGGWLAARHDGSLTSGNVTPTDPKIDALWALELEGIKDPLVPLRRFQGKPLVVNFWATWCPPCIEELPLLNAFYSQNAAKSWQVLGIAVDKRDAVLRFLDKMPLKFPVVLGGAQGIALSRELGNATGSLPFTVVLNAVGAVIHRKMGVLGPTELDAFLV